MHSTQQIMSKDGRPVWSVYPFKSILKTVYFTEDSLIRRNACIYKLALGPLPHCLNTLEAICTWIRPKLLLEKELLGAQVAAAKLRDLFPQADVSLLAERAPLLLVEDVDDLIAELRR